MNEVIQREPSTDVVVTTVAGQVAPTHYAAAPEYNEMVLSLLRQSARGGNADSLAKLGAMYACGDGVPKNYSVARALLRRAADKQHPLALYNLGVMYAQGYGVGEQIRIGELQFSLAHSARTVAIPEVRSQAASAETSEDDSATGASEGASPRRYFCAHCRVFIPNARVKRLGVVGHAKRYLCPNCSGLLEVEQEPAKPSSGLKKWLRRKARNLAAD